MMSRRHNQAAYSPNPGLLPGSRLSRRLGQLESMTTQQGGYRTTTTAINNDIPMRGYSRTDRRGNAYIAPIPAGGLGNGNGYGYNTGYADGYGDEYGDRYSPNSGFASASACPCGRRRCRRSCPGPGAGMGAGPVGGFNPGFAPRPQRRGRGVRQGRAQRGGPVSLVVGGVVGLVKLCMDKTDERNSRKEMENQNQNQNAIGVRSERESGPRYNGEYSEGEGEDEDEAEGDWVDEEHDNTRANGKHQYRPQEADQKLPGGSDGLPSYQDAVRQGQGHGQGRRPPLA